MSRYDQDRAAKLQDAEHDMIGMRTQPKAWEVQRSPHPDPRDARIDELEAEVAQLREALKPFADAAAKTAFDSAPAFHYVSYAAWNAARAAMEPKP